ncbi:hypothetical protein GOODEAATRI_002083 [Goodea atripinnis]|uniref:DDE Tnp4 domain-containing protein n=1 Tax=Goodea atripinnis TaxID=208336 RepID=A0ABV0MEE5_9TELE
MAVPIAILDCDLLLHGRGHKTLDRFDLDSVSNNFLLSNFGFPRDFILYLVELLREVAIKAPNSEASSYVNKKGFHSVACQLVCNARGLLLSAETWPGGLQDTKILQRSALYKQLQDNKEGWLLGEMCLFSPLLHYEQYSPERSSSILMACCVLHNASLHSGLDAWTLERTEPLEQPKGPEQKLEERDSEAEELQKQIILKHFS